MHAPRPAQHAGARGSDTHWQASSCCPERCGAGSLVAWSCSLAHVFKKSSSPRRKPHTATCQEVVMAKPWDAFVPGTGLSSQ